MTASHASTGLELLLSAHRSPHAIATVTYPWPPMLGGGASPHEPDGIIDPAIEDDGGYRIRHRDLRALKISPEAVDWWRKRECPLGMVTTQYKDFCSELMAALERDSINTSDLRLQGSSAHFFSGKHKTFPHTEQEWETEFHRNFRRSMTPAELSSTRNAFNAWFTDGELPRRRPFDSIYVLDLNRDKSDYDLQISCDAIVSFATAIATTDDNILHPDYGFLNKDLVERVCPNLTQWAEEQADQLDRPVTVAVFPSSGPKKKMGPVSSHFKDSDWIIEPEARS